MSKPSPNAATVSSRLSRKTQPKPRRKSPRWPGKSSPPSPSVLPLSQPSSPSVPDTPPPPIRVAIARFDNQTGNPALDRFADGLTDTLVAEMTAAGAGQLAIIGNAAVLRLPREKRDLAAIANSVRASYVVLGQVQQSASGTRVLAHLIRLPDGSHIEVVRLDPAAPNDLDDSGSGFSKRVATNFPKRILTDARQKQNSQFWPSVSFQRYLAPRLFLASKPVGPSPRLGMPTFPLRRTLLKLAPLSLASQAAFPAGKALSSTFPAQPPELAQEMVSVSHGNLERVRELVTAHPTLAKATWDWGFGDWETALGAASHVGNREIALYLIEQGATPTLFSAAMLGQLATVKAIVAANPAAQRIPGPHSIGLLTHARNGGTPAAQVLLYLESLGDADAPPAIPLTQADMLAIAGTYNFGTNDHIEISLAKGAAVFQRQGTTARNLHHLGNRVFHPAGAAAVRIAFKESPAATTLSILDPGLVLTATKSASPA